MKEINNTKMDGFSVQLNVRRLGFWVSLLTGLSAAAALLIATTTAPSRSGPFCMEDIVGSCVVYPFTDVAEFVPIEYIWMYPALLMALTFTVLVVCIHYAADEKKKIFSQLALLFALIAAAAHSINYFIQLAVVQPSLLKGEFEGLTLFSQYNPHGIFIALEDLGYLMMGFAFLFIVFALKNENRLDKVIRTIFLVGSILAIGGLAVLAVRLGSDLEYIYEVLAIVVDWGVLIFNGALMAVFFRRLR